MTDHEIKATKEALMQKLDNYTFVLKTREEITDYVFKDIVEPLEKDIERLRAEIAEYRRYIELEKLGK